MAGYGPLGRRDLPLGCPLVGVKLPTRRATGRLLVVESECGAVAVG
jgi:hypothetical protein